MKKMRIITSLFLSIILIVSMLMQISFADSYAGSEALSYKGTAPVIKTNAPIGGKLSSDAYYEVSYACTGWNTSVYMTDKGNILEFQFLLPDDSAQVNIYPRSWSVDAQSSSYSTNNHFEINSAGMSWLGGTASGDKNKVKWTEPYDVEVGKWHTLIIQYVDKCASDGLQNGSYYIDGECIKTNDSSISLYGYRQIGIGPASADHPVLFDNINNWYGRTGADSSKYIADVSKRTPSLITEVADGYEFNNTDKTITVPNGATVSDLLSAITTTDGTDDAIRVYTTSAMTTETSSDATANGTTLVIAAKNGTDIEQAYSYYTVAEAAPVDPDADVLKGGNASDLTVLGNTNYTEGGSDAEIAIESGVFGKTSEDSAYKFTRTNDKAYINYECAHKSDTFSLFEFGFVKSDAEDNFRLEMNYYTNAEQSSRVSSTMYFKNGGLQWGATDTNLYAQPFEVGKWYTIAVQFPTNGDTEVPVYVNGNLAFTGEIADGAYGLAYARFKNSTNKTFYLDNIRDAEEVYAPAKDAKASISVENGAVQSNKLKLLFEDENKTPINIGASDTMRMYKSDWTTAANLSEADFVVVAAKNGRNIERTYTYLDKEIVSLIVDYSKETQEDVTSLNANLMSTEDGATLIVAWYEGDEFVELQTATATQENDIYTAEKQINALNDNYTYRIFAWNSVEGLYPLTKVTDVK